MYRVVRAKPLTSAMSSRQVVRLFGRYEAAVEYANEMNEYANVERVHYIVEEV